MLNIKNLAIIPFIWCIISCVPMHGQQQVTTPNLSLQIPSFGQTNWQIPLQYDLYKIDSMTLQVPPANGVPYYSGSGASRLATQADIQTLLGQAGASSSGWLSTTDWNRFNTGLGNSLAAPASPGLIWWTGSATRDGATADVVALLNGSSALTLGALGATSVNLNQGSFAATLSPATTMTASYNWHLPGADANGAVTINNDQIVVTPLQGTDSKILTVGTVTATTGSTLCTDANGGATTTGCSTGGGGGISILNATTPITGSIAGSTLNLSLATVPVTSGGTGATTAAQALTNLGAQAAGNYITALTGDATASGPGSVALTLANVNGAPGTCGDATHVCQVTSDAKGRITTSSAIAISSMVYPGAGIPVSTGSAWTTSKTAPSGALVGTTDTQTLTNKTVDGVSPSTMGFLDATSSIQTQLNAKLSSLAIQQGGSSIGSASILNCSTNVNCSVSGNVATITATGGGGGGGTVPPYFSATVSNGASQTIGTDCSTGTPCIARIGLAITKVTAPASFTVPSGGQYNDTAYIYIDPTNGQLTIGTQTVSTTCSGCTAVTGITNFPNGAIPLWVATISSPGFGQNSIVTALTDDRALFSVPLSLAAGNCIVLTPGSASEQIAVDSSNPSCAGGGSTFNGGTITAPLTISTNGLSANTPLLKLLMSNSGGYNTLEMDDDLGNGWQIGVPGSGNTASQLGLFYLYDKKNSNAWLSVDNLDQVHITSLTGGSEPLQISSANTGATVIQITNLSTGGHGWILSAGGQTNNPGTFGFYDATTNSTEMRLDSSSHEAILNNIILGGAGGTLSGSYSPGTCVDGKVGWDTGQSTNKLEACVGGTWHHISFTD